MGVFFGMCGGRGVGLGFGVTREVGMLTPHHKPMCKQTNIEQAARPRWWSGPPPSICPLAISSGGCGPCTGRRR